jgi:hypothetical protein
VATRKGHKDLADRLAPIAVALLARLLRRLIPSLRSTLSPPRDLLTWQHRRRAMQRAAEQQRRERRRRIAIAVASVALAAAITTARVLTRR